MNGDAKMDTDERSFLLTVEKTTQQCPIGEIVGNKNQATGKIPVFSCEGACIRGEIARQAANIVAKTEPYRRGCHGELMTVPESAIAKWTGTADKIILIDGFFLRCHGRAMEALLGRERLIQFDALSHYKRYSDIFDMDDVPAAERSEVAQSVASWVLNSLDQSTPVECAPDTQSPCQTFCS
jgi:uncharacterized metal-binding protein